MNVVALNARARRAAINAAIWQEADQQPARLSTRDERLLLLTGRLGDVTSAHLNQTGATADALLRLIGTAAAALEDLETKSAA